MAAPKSFLGAMVSSTYTDLTQHREAVIRLIHSHGLLPIEMEHHGTVRADLNVLESSLQMVRDSAAYIAIIGRRYGQIPSARNPRGLSITELEFEEAARLKRPILLFLMADDHPVRERDIDLDPFRRKKLAAFRERAKRWQAAGAIERVYEEFSSLEKFKDAAAIAIPRLKKFLDDQLADNRRQPDTRQDGRTRSHHGLSHWTQSVSAQLAGVPRLELLCDRVRADSGFRLALERTDRCQPGCLILFGESDQGQAEYLARMKAYTIRLWEERYPQREVIKVDLDDYTGDQVGEVAAQIFESGAVALKYAPAATAASLYEMVRKRKLDLCLIYSAVRVHTKRQAREWIDCLERIQGMFALQRDGAQIVLALSIEYPRGFWLLPRGRAMERFFRKSYPDEFREERRGRRRAALPTERPGIAVRRLSPVRQEHVNGWCDHRLVQAHIPDIDVARERLLMLFNKPGKELPMQTVLKKLKEILRHHAGRGSTT